MEVYQYAFFSLANFMAYSFYSRQSLPKRFHTEDVSCSSNSTSRQSSSGLPRILQLCEVESHPFHLDIEELEWLLARNDCERISTKS